MTALHITDCHKTYQGGVNALKGISFSVEEGDFFALLGPNGAGKSTTIGIITSLVQKTSGKVQVFGHDIDNDFANAKACIGLVPQEFNFNIFETVLDIILNQAGYYGVPRGVARQRAEKYLKKLELWEKRNTPAQQLSGGMKRRLMIARALVHEPKLLILDEPTAGVDIEIRRSMWHFFRDINQQGITVILTTHYLEEAENLCKNIAIINHGHIVENTSMKALIQKLNVETFLLDIKNPLHFVPEISEFTLRLYDETTLEVDIHQQQTLNELFELLKQHDITVNSMRNKANRLEELFLGMINHEENVA